MIRQSQFDSVLIPLIQHHFDLGMQSVNPVRDQIFNIQTSSFYQEKGTTLGGVSVDAWDTYSQGGGKGELEFSQLYTQTYTHVEYPVRFTIQKKLLLNDQYGQIGKIVERVGMSAANKMEIDAAKLFNNAFATDTWADSQFLCDTDHPVGGSTHSNRGTTALSESALSATRILMMRFPDDKGNLLGVMADELYVPPELEDAALKATRSILNPDTGNNAMNPQNGRYNVIVVPRLTDTNNWFMGSSQWRRQAVNWYNREDLQLITIEDNTTEIVYEAKLHYSWGVDDWRWIYGHIVA